MLSTRLLTFLLLLATTSSSARVEDMREVVAGNTVFAVDLYQRLTTGDENVIFSPFSVSTALAIAYVGAGGETGAQIRRTLHFSTRDATTHSGFGTLLERLSSEGAPWELHVANRLWGDQRMELAPRYVKHSNRFYGSSLEQLDFAMRPADARDEINLWVASQTNEMIKNLMPEGSITNDTRLVITNAIYFKSAWTTRFDKEKTKPATFTTLEGEELTRDFMNVKAEFGYLNEDGMQVLRLPYADGRLSMILALPDNHDAISKLGESLTERFADWIERLPKSERTVAVSIPRFKLARKFGLAKALSAMGMPLAFTKQADFHGIANEDLFIQAVIHEAVIEVSEEGTEAAAATGISIGVTSVQPKKKDPIFRADHPFLFLIHDSDTGSILFIGRVMNPTPPED